MKRNLRAILITSSLIGLMLLGSACSHTDTNEQVSSDSEFENPFGPIPEELQTANGENEANSNQTTDSSAGSQNADNNEDLLNSLTAGAEKDVSLAFGRTFQTYSLSAQTASLSVTYSDNSRSAGANDSYSDNSGSAGTMERGIISDTMNSISTGEPTENIYKANGQRLGDYPLELKLYQSSSRYSTYDVTFTVVGDTITIKIPYSISDEMMQNAYVEFLGDNLECSFEDNPDYADEDGTVNLMSSPILIVTNEKNHSTTEYTIEVERETHDLPVLYLTTDSGEEVTDRYEFVDGGLTIDNSCGMMVSNGSNYAEKVENGTPIVDTFHYDETTDIQIRGRGNASWWKFPQKSYMIKFDENTSLFGMTAGKKYALISTYLDYSLVRNCVAMDIATVMDNLEYTPGQIPVDVFINGNYMGIYTLSEKVDVASDKVNLFSDSTYSSIRTNNVTDIAFLLECGGYVKDTYTSGLDYFYTSHSPQLFFKYPEITEQYSEEEQYIEDYMNQVDQAISRGYGYEDYIDVDSWVDWFIVMELTNNTDSSLCRSTYLYKRADGKLMIGPVWDFDTAFGNFTYDNPTYECWATAEAIYVMAQGHYMTDLYNSDAFMQRVQERWDEKKDELLQAALDAVDKYGEEVAASRPYNNEVKGMGYNMYQLETIRNFIRKRYNWIDMSLHMADYNRHPATESVPQAEPDENAVLMDPNLGIAVDQNTLVQDPTTGQWIDPATGAVVDPNTWNANTTVDPNTGLPPDTNAVTDPNTTTANTNANANPDAAVTDPNAAVTDPNTVTDPNATADQNAAITDPNAALNP